MIDVIHRFSLPALMVSLAVALSALAPAQGQDRPPAGPGESDVGWDDRVGRELMNLGPIGARGFLLSDGGKFPMHYLGDTITVRKVFDGSPAAGKLLEDDVIVGVNGQKLKPADCQFMIARAIDAAEASDGKLSLQVIRGGQKISVNLELPRLGQFSPTVPYQCPKTQRLLENACRWILTQQQPDGGWTLGGGTITADICCLTLLGSGDAKYLPACQATVKWMLANQYQAQGWNWHLAWNAIFLSEYYLATHDAIALPPLREIESAMIRSQIRYPGANDKYSGGWAHAALSPELTAQLTDPKIIPKGLGYTELNIATMQNVAALGLMKQCGVSIDDKCVQTALNYLKKCSDVLPGISYSNWGMSDNPITGDGTETGFNPTYSSIFAIGLSEFGQEQSWYCRRCVMWASNPLNDLYTPFGHAEHHFGMFWTPCALALLNPPALIRYTAQMRDYDTLCRMYDGSFTTLPSHEELLAKGSCGREFGRAWSTGWHGMILALGMGRLHIAGGAVAAARAMPGSLREIARELGRGEYGAARNRLDRVIAQNHRAIQAGDGEPPVATHGDAHEGDGGDRLAGELAEQLLATMNQASERDLADILAAEQSGDVYLCLTRADKFMAKFGLDDPRAPKVSTLRNRLHADAGAMREFSTGAQYYRLLQSLEADAAMSAARQRVLANFASQHVGSVYAKMALARIGPESDAN
jgi:hypothetical protein